MYNFITDEIWSKKDVHIVTTNSRKAVGSHVKFLILWVVDLYFHSFWRPPAFNTIYYGDHVFSCSVPFGTQASNASCWLEDTFFALETAWHRLAVDLFERSAQKQGTNHEFFRQNNGKKENEVGDELEIELNCNNKSFRTARNVKLEYLILLKPTVHWA